MEEIRIEVVQAKKQHLSGRSHQPLAINIKGRGGGGGEPADWNNYISRQLLRVSPLNLSLEMEWILTWAQMPEPTYDIKLKTKLKWVRAWILEII